MMRIGKLDWNDTDSADSAEFTVRTDECCGAQSPVHEHRYNTGAGGCGLWIRDPDLQFVQIRGAAEFALPRGVTDATVRRYIRRQLA